MFHNASTVTAVKLYIRTKLTNNPSNTISIVTLKMELNYKIKIHFIRHREITNIAVTYTTNTISSVNGLFQVNRGPLSPPGNKWH